MNIEAIAHTAIEKIRREALCLFSYFNALTISS